MGKRASRKTKWRALDIADEHSDSEESNTNSSAVSSRYSHHSNSNNGYYSTKYSNYSSQSTPARRRYIHPYDGVSTKSTRSSSTTSENKITFNEDEYTRITTPRQDVLFKKGYLNKPKSYQTQTSTGNSTISTGNSTENGTPDHQSTDLDYESQFMFPNGFVDQHGIYYVNSYEPYPLMLYNPPTYYQEFSNSKTKRHSTGSLSESMSPNNEEATSQDLSQSGGEASISGVSDYSGGPPVFNMVYPGYYVNGGCTPTDLANSQHHHHAPEPVKKLKKRRERKSSKTIPGDSSEYTDENSGEETSENSPLHRVCIPEHLHQEAAGGTRVEGVLPPTADTETPSQPQHDQPLKTATCTTTTTTTTNHDQSSSSSLSNGCADTKTDLHEEILDADQDQPLTFADSRHNKPSTLKPDAEEFVPRFYHHMGLPPHYKMMPPNFMPIPLVPIGDFGGQNFAPHPAFIPPGIPINFIPHHPHLSGQKMFPPPQGYISYAPPMLPTEANIEETCEQNDETNVSDERERERESTATPSHTPVVEESNKTQTHSKAIDIATVVSKLEAVKQQERQDLTVTTEEAPEPIQNENKPFRDTPRLAKPQNLKRNYYNKYRNSPVRYVEPSPPQIYNGDSTPSLHESPQHFRHSNVRVVDSQLANNETQARISHRNSPVRHVEVPQQIKHVEILQRPLLNGFEKQTSANGVYSATSNYSRQVRDSPERFQQKKSWKPNGYQSGYQSNYSSPKRIPNNYQSNQSHQKDVANGTEKPYYTNIQNNVQKYYSESVRKAQSMPQQVTEQKTQPLTITSSPVKVVAAVEDAKTEKPKSSNQWISVSSRKKKKNKNADECEADATDSAFNDSGDTSSDIFESYDVSQLVDVVPSQIANQNTKIEEKRIEQILTSIAKSESTEVLANALRTPTDITIPEVSDIEKEIIVKMEEDIQPSTDTIEETVIVIPTVKEKSESVKDDASVSEIVSSEPSECVEEGFKPKKRSKKGTQKPLTKKVIITDVFNDLSIEPVEPKTPQKKDVKKIEEIKAVLAEPKEPLVIPVPELKPVKEATPEAETEQSEKKSKKKRKNKSVNKAAASNNMVSDESYAVLLKKGPFRLAVECQDKSNDEITLELDKLIQKGMYGSLEEKIKSINVVPEADAFFKTIGAVAPLSKDTSTATLKAPDFNRIFQSTRQFLKPNMVSVKHDNTDNKVVVDDIDDKRTKACSSTADAADPSTGLALDNVPEVPNASVDSDVEVTPADPEDVEQEPEADTKLYPITQAVKEWMSKTREATPEVEILKSPCTIQKEFGGGGVGNGLKDHLDSDLEDEDDELTLFSSSDETTGCHEQPDLLEYWDNELPVVSIKDCDVSKDIIVSDVSKVCADGKSCDKCRTESIEQGGEQIEVYESKYGHNEVFLHLQTEVKMREKPKQTPNGNRPSSGYLPHRAVCCSLQ